MATSYIEEKHYPITWKKLYEADVNLPMPFILKLKDTSTLISEKLIRFVPRKRIIVFGMWNNQKVVAKIFFHPKKAHATFARDVRGVKILHAVNIPSAKLLYEGEAFDQPQLRIMILEKIENAMTLFEVWRLKKSIAEVMPLLRAVTIELATHHVLGIIQRDLHLKNFLITTNTIYSLDGSKIVDYHYPLSKKISLKYLALFLVQFGVGTETLRKELFELYAKARGWIITQQDVKYLYKEIRRTGHRLTSHYLQKIFRNSTSFKKIDKFTRTIFYDREYQTPEFIKLLHQPEWYFNEYPHEVLKAGRSATVIKININQRTFVIKRYNIKNIWHRIRRFFKKTRAANSWRLAQKLFSQGILTPKPVAIVEKKFLSFKGKSYFIMEYVQGLNLGDYIAQANFTEINALSKKIFTLFKNLKEMGLIHGDFKKTNIIIHNDNPILIDLDGMKEYRINKKFFHKFNKDIQRFLQNFETEPLLHDLFSNLLQGTLTL